MINFRLKCSGPDSQAKVWNDFASILGTIQGRKSLQSFVDLCRLCSQHRRRPLMQHQIDCKCLGSDESCFANFTATTTDRGVAMLIATLVVRPDMAPMITSLTADFGLALKRMNLRAPKDYGVGARPSLPDNHTLH